MDIPEDNLIMNFRGQFRFLSNFYPVPHGVWFMDVRYPTVEHAYVAGKTLDINTRIHVTRHQSPADVKADGRRIKLRKDWDEFKLLHMEGLLRGKFQPGTGLADLLMRTGTAKLVEGNTHGDTFWGRCRGKGANHLGLLLMEIRDDLQVEQEKYV